MILQTIHKSAATRLFMGFLAVMMVFVTFESKANNLKGVTYSGETIFKGIFFAEGPVAEHIPILQGMSARDFARSDEDHQKIDDFHASVMNYIKDHHPAYIADLKAAIESKKHPLISQKIEEGRQILEATIDGIGLERDLEAEQRFKDGLKEGIKEGMSLEEMKAVASAEMTELEAGMDSQIVVFLLFPVSLYIHVIWFLSPTDYSEESALFKETVVNSLVKL